MHYHCLTMRKCAAPRTLSQVERTIDEYEWYVKRLKEKDEQLDIRFHYELVLSNNGRYNVHIHGMIRTPNDHVPVFQKKGYSIRIELCRSKMAWNAYITKSPRSKMDILCHISDLEEEPIDDGSLDDHEPLPGGLRKRAVIKEKLF